MSSALTVRTRRAVESPTPGYFALVMASGIISVGLDLMDPRRAFGFFTFVAGTNVLGVRPARARWRSRPGRWCSWP